MLQQSSNLDTFDFNSDYLYIMFKPWWRRTNGTCSYSECFIVLWAPVRTDM